MTNMVNKAFPVGVTDGGTDVTTHTAYGVLCAGTTTTGALQNAGAGTSGQALTSNGAGVLPSYQALPGLGSTNAYQYISTATASNSADNYDAIEFVGIIADTTWATRLVLSSGVTTA